MPRWVTFIPVLAFMVPMLRAQSDAIVVLKGGVNPAVRRQNDQGAVDAGKKLGSMTLLLTRSPAQRAALSRLLQEQQDLSSPNYHKWLKPEEFGERFGVSRNDLDPLTDWLKSQGFNIESTARGRGWIVFSGTAAQVENAFHTQIRRYQSKGKMHFANAEQPSIPAAFEDLVVGIRGLDDFYPEPPPQPQYTSSTGFHALAPDDFALIYDVAPLFSAGIDGTGVGIAVIGQSDFNLADIATFRQSFGLPAQVPQQILAGPDPGFNDSESEADLDLEWSGAVARGATLTYVYANDAFFAVSYAIDNNVAPIVTFSFSLCEAGLSAADATSLEDTAQQGNAQGITWISSSGDTGPAECDRGDFPATHGLTTAIPASVPDVTAVGGTEFIQGNQYWSATNRATLGSAVSYIPEFGWNDTAYYDNTIVASGGGASQLYPHPYWQVFPGPGVPNTARDVPDVSLAASAVFTPYMVVVDGKNVYRGGTSASAPAFAGIIALLNHYLLDGGMIQEPGLANINPFLYGFARDGLGIFHYVNGNNVVPCQPGTPDCPSSGLMGYSAGVGNYDQVTGLGSVDAYKLATQWNPAFAIGPPTQPPPPPVLFAPASGTTGDFAYIDLDWYPAGNATSYDVYFGASDPPPFWGNQATPNCVPIGLAGGTTYYWRVVARNDAGSASSATWSLNTYTTYAVSVVAGNGASFYSADNVPATSTGLSNPSAIALDGAGNFYIADFDNNRIRKVSNGIITTVAGNGDLGYSGDNGSAIDAMIGPTSSMAVDGDGNLYIADTSYCRIRKVSNGVISTVAGNGSCVYGGDGGPAISAGMHPDHIAADAAGNLYLTEADQYSVRKISNGVINTVAGNGSSGFSGDGGPATEAQLNVPAGIAVDAAGNLYIADINNARVRKVSNGVITTVAGNGTQGSTVDYVPATTAMLNHPYLAVPDTTGNLYIVQEDSDHCISKVSGGILSSVVVNGSPGNCPSGLAVDAADNFYVIFGNGDLHVYRFSASTAPPVSTISSGGVVNSASFAAAVAPGGLASVWGNYLVDPPVQATSIPLPTTLDGLSIQIGSTLAPLLYASVSLVNLQIPWEAAGQSQVALSAFLNGQSGPTQTAKLVPFAPGIFAMNGQGTGQGAILDASYKLVDSSNPAVAGSRVQIYCTGLGPVTNPPASGFPASSDVLSYTTNTLTVTIGGANAPVEFSGLTPGETGLYQVNAIVPSGLPPGSAIPVSISIGGAISNTVTLAIN